jgi:hypothetical protein
MAEILCSPVPSLVVAAHKHHLSTFGSKDLGDSFASATTGACYECHPFLQPAGHTARMDVALGGA